MRNFVILLMCVLTLSQCKSKIYSMDNLPKEFIEIGSYGGFAGTQKTIYFFPNGQRFMAESRRDNAERIVTNEIESYGTEDFKQMKDELIQMNFHEIQQNEVGNMTYFIRFKTKKMDSTVKWSNMDTGPLNLTNYYTKFLRNIQEAAIN